MFKAYRGATVNVIAFCRWMLFVVKTPLFCVHSILIWIALFVTSFLMILFFEVIGLASGVGMQAILSGVVITHTSK